MTIYPLITKASGEEQHFDREKLLQSLLRSGAGETIANKVTDEITSRIKPGMTTGKIYHEAYTLLGRIQKSKAARYSLKKAMMELGPTGYPFEQFVGQVLASQGFEVKVGQVLQGNCVTHEIDVVANQNNTQYLVECKFYNSPGKYASVQVPLYVRSRVNDIIAFREKFPEYHQTRFFGWVVTNTRFTNDALTYGRCAGLHMLSWDIPEERSLKHMVEDAGLYPVTVLTQLNKQQKIKLMEMGIVTCPQLHSNSTILDGIELAQNKRKALLDELSELCE